MMKFKIILSTVLLGLFFFFNCNETDKSPVVSPEALNMAQPAVYVSRAESDLDLFAKALAQMMNERSVSEVVNFKLGNAETRENIVDFGEFIKSSTTVEGHSIMDKMAAVCSEISQKDNARPRQLTRENILERLAAFEPMLDIYFPVAGHHERWLENKDELLIAYNPVYLDDDYWTGITAYTLSGEKRVLDAKTAPGQPVLVIARCEHRGNHFIEAPQVCPPHCGGGSGGSNNPPTWRIRITDFRLMDDWEPWPAGAPEIYVETSHPAGSVDPDWRRTDFPHVNNEQLYDEGAYSWLPKAIYSEPQSSGNYIFENTEVRIREDDGFGTFGDDVLEVDYWWPEPAHLRTDFRHSPSLGYQSRDWFYGPNADADIRMYVVLDNPPN